MRIKFQGFSTSVLWLFRSGLLLVGAVWGTVGLYGAQHPRPHPLDASRTFSPKL